MRRGNCLLEAVTLKEHGYSKKTVDDWSIHR